MIYKHDIHELGGKNHFSSLKIIIELRSKQQFENIKIFILLRNYYVLPALLSPERPIREINGVHL